MEEEEGGIENGIKEPGREKRIIIPGGIRNDSHTQAADGQIQQMIGYRSSRIDPVHLLTRFCPDKKIGSSVIFVRKSAFPESV
ncbi:hypothetical protein [Paenibacillus chitinolyticus]|uniref:hypothetical protein n=1 Tax=Paenibacillus chitinolyticus TaxID=79263 RepID=UPI00295E416A|nr:hypothetical protein [Paenibacillus chitinolyticus]